MESLPAVLIVDDDRVVLHTMQDQLSRENYRVAAIANVTEALQRLRIERFGIIYGRPIHARDAWTRVFADMP